MVMVTRVVGSEGGDGDGNINNVDNGNGNNDGRHVTVTKGMATAMATAAVRMWTMARAIRVVGYDEGNGDGEQP